eukprot:753069-Hanusia_phi.AAC.4
MSRLSATGWVKPGSSPCCPRLLSPPCSLAPNPSVSDFPRRTASERCSGKRSCTRKVPCRTDPRAGFHSCAS